MAGLPITREIPALMLRAEVVPGSINKEKRIAEVTWTTGARVLRQPWFDEPFLEELSLDPAHVRMDFLASGKAPVLDAHQQWGGMASQIGVIDTARLDGERGTASLRFSQREDVTPIWQDVQDEIVRNVSVGYQVHKYLRMDPGVEGGDPQYPVYRAVDWTPKEISPVPLPADTGAEFRGDAAAGATPARYRCTLVFRSEETTMKDPITPATAAPPPPAAADPVKPVDATRAAAEAATKAERERAEQIRGLVKRQGLDGAMADELVTKGATLEQARVAVLDKLAAASDEIRTEQHVQVGDEPKDKFLRGAQAWLLERSSVDLIRRAQAAKVKGFEGLELDGGEYRGMTLLELAKESLRLRGVNTRGWDKLRIAGAALGVTRDAGVGMATTSDFTILFENTLNKMLLGAYATTPDTWSRICKVDTVPDFRPSNRYRVGSFGTLDSKNEKGEFKSKAIPDGEKRTISVATKGNIIAITREAIINDDMGSLADLAARFGRAARLTIEVDFYALLALNSGLGPTMSDSNPFFHSSRSNVNGTGSAISVAGIEADANAMAAQRDPSGNEILDLRPSVLLVPKTLGGEARVINDAQYDPVDNKFQKPNRVRGLFRDVVDTARMTGTRRYLFADPGIAPAFVVAFLEGQGQAPYLEQRMGFEVDGTEWKVRLDFKVQEFDPRGAVTNAGV